MGYSRCHRQLILWYLVLWNDIQPGLTLDILRMASWVHMGRTASITIKDTIHIFASISKIMHILLMGRRNREHWQHIPGNIHVYLFWLVSNCYLNIYFTVGSYWIHAAQLSIFIMLASLLHLGQSYHCPSTNEATLKWIYRQVSNIRCTLVGNKIVDHSDVVRTSPVGAAPTTSSFSTWHLASTDWVKTTTRWNDKHLSFEISCVLYKRLYGTNSTENW